MKSKITLLIVSLFTLSTTYANDVACEFAYQDAGYGLQHIETAMEANNIDHLRQYAQRSKIAVEKVLASTERCGCIDANYASYDAIENLSKALKKTEFDQIRFFVNRAKINTKKILVSLDVCSTNDPADDLKAQEGNLLAKEQQLLLQQQELLAQQQQLQEQIAAQKKMQEDIKLEKEAMLVEQKKVQLEAETSLLELEVLINKFTNSMGCKDTKSLTESSFQRNNSVLQGESLEGTKIFYAEKAKEMANAFFNRLSGCEWRK